MFGAIRKKHNDTRCLSSLREKSINCIWYVYCCLLSRQDSNYAIFLTIKTAILFF